MGDFVGQCKDSGFCSERGREALVCSPADLYRNYVKEERAGRGSNSPMCPGLSPHRDES